MGLFDRFVKKPITPSITKKSIPGLSGALTAHQAWGVINPIVKAMDSNARFTLITSGTDINDKGCSRSWEFVFILPAHSIRVMLSLEPDPETEDVDSSTCILTQRISQASSNDKSVLALPEKFRNSPEVVAEFVASGVDFVAGPSDMKLESRMLPSGKAVWVTYFWDREYSTSFSSI